MTVVLELLRMVGIEKIVEKIFMPPLRLFGIQKEAMNIIIVGMTIGLQFGGGMLILLLLGVKINTAIWIGFHVGMYLSLCATK